MSPPEIYTAEVKPMLLNRQLRVHISITGIFLFSVITVIAAHRHTQALACVRG